MRASARWGDATRDQIGAHPAPLFDWPGRGRYIDQSYRDLTMAHSTSFPPPQRDGAHIASAAQYKEMYRASLDDPQGFWAEHAQELHWFRPWERVLEWKRPDAKWFVGGKTNLSYNCIDRQIDQGYGDQTAIIWEGEPIDGEPEVRRLTYAQLKTEVCKVANVLKSLGVTKGDRVTIYMPMVPELAIAMLACARIGAPHSIIFAGFSANAIKSRVKDAQSKVLLTSDGGWRRGKILDLKKVVDDALYGSDLVESVLVLRRCGNAVKMKAGRDHWWHERVDDADAECACEEMDSEDLLFLLYTSGTTGTPKGIMHTTGGYMVYTYLTAKYVFDLRPDDPDELYWCTADIGWITGHSYIVYGILPNRVPTFMYEGAPSSPGPDRFWDMVERHRITKFYTAPTAVRTFMKWGDDQISAHDLSSLKILGTVGEPINPEAWLWYHRQIGGERCPIVDTWWQTETGGHLLTPLPYATTTVPGSATHPFFGIDAAVVNEQGEEVEAGAEGFLVIRTPWPSMLRGIYGDRERFIDTYWSKFETAYFAGDAARRDADGNFWVIGRVDDVINVAGHRLGTAEIESALVAHSAVVEAAVVGVPHEIKGTAIAAFVTVGGGVSVSDGLKAELVDQVARELGAFAKPDQIRFTDVLPKTRSGKIMRRLLKQIAAGTEVTGDTTTLEDMSVIAKLSEGKSS